MSEAFVGAEVQRPALCQELVGDLGGHKHSANGVSRRLTCQFGSAGGRSPPVIGPVCAEFHFGCFIPQKQAENTPQNLHQHDEDEKIKDDFQKTSHNDSEALPTLKDAWT